MLRWHEVEEEDLEIDYNGMHVVCHVDLGSVVRITIEGLHQPKSSHHACSLQSFPACFSTGSPKPRGTKIWREIRSCR